MLVIVFFLCRGCCCTQPDAGTRRFNVCRSATGQRHPKHLATGQKCFQTSTSQLHSIPAVWRWYIVYNSYSIHLQLKQQQSVAAQRMFHYASCCYWAAALHDNGLLAIVRGWIRDRV